jgi:ferredoxin-NADP reductase
LKGASRSGHKEHQGHEEEHQTFAFCSCDPFVFLVFLVFFVTTPSARAAGGRALDSSKVHTLNATVTSVRPATPSTRIVRVRPSRTPFLYRAGQAAEIGPANASTLTPYSIASAPEDTLRDGCLEFLVKVDAYERWGEDYDPLARGQALRLRGPSGRFTFPENVTSGRFLLIAGGTGIAPLRSMIRHGRALGAGIEFRLLYSARTPADFAYKSELVGMARRGEVGLTLTATRDVPERWRGERGRITKALLAPLMDERPQECFVCGPAAMVDDVPRILVELGLERSRIRVEEW